jgi:hypothetical protein
LHRETTKRNAGWFAAAIKQHRRAAYERRACRQSGDEVLKPEHDRASKREYPRPVEVAPHDEDRDRPLRDAWRDYWSSAQSRRGSMISRHMGETGTIVILSAAVVILGGATIFWAVRSVEFRKFLAGAFFVSGGIQFYLYLAGVSVPLLGTGFVQTPDLSRVRSIVHMLLFAITFYFGFVTKRRK